MEITNKDVKVLGRVASITTDGIVASAEQVYDDTYKEGMFQSDINKELLENISEVNIPTKVSELENDSNYQSAEQVEQKINSLVNSAPEALDTLKELADALNSDPNFATTVTNQLSNKADKTELDKYLLKTGGVITGTLYMKYASFIMDKYNISQGHNPKMQFDSQKGTITLINYNTSIDGGQDEESITKFGPFGVVLNNKTANDLLTAAGSTTTLKTINGQSIFGEGNIEINSGDVFPEGGTTGQVLKKTSTGVEWGNDNDTKYTLPIASDTVLGGVKVGEGLSVTGDGILSCTVTPGSDTVSWDNITGKPSFATVATSGSYNDLTDKPAAYTLPTASSSQLGGVKIGEGINVEAGGTISAADDVVTLANLYAAKGDIPMVCSAGPFINNLYFIKSPASGDSGSTINTGDYYHLCVMKSGTSTLLQTTCSTVADTFPGMDKYFVIKDTLLYLKNNVIYHATQGTDAGYFVSNEKGDTLTNVASRFETLAEARAFMREKMLALPDIGIVKCTSEEYEGGAKNENTLYIIQG